jgi:hypothetical protein
MTGQRGAFPVLAARLSVLVLAATLAGCSALGMLRDILKPPIFQAAPNRPAQLRLVMPSLQHPLGGATVRLFARVQNPNPVGFTLSALAGSLFLEGVEAAHVSFPLGVPLVAQQEAVVPLDITLNFSDLPNLGAVAKRALTGSPLAYRLNGTVTVDAGALGRPTFGPSTLLEGQVQPIR